MQPENNPIDIATIIDDTDNLIRRINAHLEELENKYNIEKRRLPDLLKVRFFRLKSDFSFEI